MKRALTSLALIALLPNAEANARVTTNTTDLPRYYKKLSAADKDLRAKRYSGARSKAAALAVHEEISDIARNIESEAALHEADALLSRKRYGEAESAARAAHSAALKITAETPGSPWARRAPETAGAAEIRVARSLVGRKRYRSGLSVFFQAIERLHSVNALGLITAAEAADLAHACRKSKSADCDGWLKKLVSLHPKGSPESDGILKIYPEAGEKFENPEPFARLSQPYKNPDADLAAAEEKILEGKIDGFREFEDRFPRSSQRARIQYWLGRALKKDGKEEEAAGIFEKLRKDSPLSWYGMMAATELALPIDAALTEEPVAPSREFALEALLPTERRRLERAEKLLKAKLKSHAGAELRDLRSRESLPSSLLWYWAQLAREAGEHPAVFVLISELIQRGDKGATSRTALEYIFPLDHEKVIRAAAEEAEIDPVLFLSLVKQESAFDPRAQSHVGAMGWSQLMHATALEVQPGVARGDLNDTTLNLKIGANYLKKLLKKYKGNVAYALAAYNSGPTATDRWIKANAGEKGDRPEPGTPEFIETIGYRETREYVASILRNVRWYTLLLERKSEQR